MLSATYRNRQANYVSWCFLLTAFYPVLAWGNEVSPKQHCLAIGINRVATPEPSEAGYLPLSPLKFAVKDAVGFADAIRSHNMIQPTVTLLTDDDATQTLNLERVMAAIREASEAETETLVVYLTGHSFSYEDADYFCVSDTKLRRVNAKLQIENALSVSEIIKTIGQSNARKKILIMDGSRDSLGTASSTKIQPDILYAFSAGEPTLALVMSCLPDQISLEVEDLGHGLFSHFLIEGLRGACDYDQGNRDGEVSLQELFHYATRRTTSYALEKCGRKQVPWIQISGAENIVLSELSDNEKFALNYTFRDVNFDAKSASFERQMAMEQYTMALDAFGLLEYGECIERLTKVLEALPNHEEAIRLRSLCYRLSGEVVEAIDDMKKLQSSLKAKVFASDPSLLGIRAPNNTQTILFDLLPGDWVEIVNYSSEGKNSRGEILPAGKYLYVSRLKRKGSEEWIDAKGVIFADAIRLQSQEPSIRLDGTDITQTSRSTFQRLPPEVIKKFLKLMESSESKTDGQPQPEVNPSREMREKPLMQPGKMNSSTILS